MIQVGIGKSVKTEIHTCSKQSDRRFAGEIPGRLL